MKTFQYVVVKYVPNLLRDESVNVGVIARDPASGAFDFRFLSRGGVVKKIWPHADTQIVRHLTRALKETKQSQLTLDEPVLGRAGNPSAADFFSKARREFTGNLQLTSERAVRADDLESALQWAYTNFVAEPATSARPINYQALAPFQTRQRLWRAFERRELVGPRRVRERVVLQGRHAPWTFDLAYKNGAQHLINSLALNAAPEVNLGRALVFKGMLEEVSDRLSDDIKGIAVLQRPKPDAWDKLAVPRATAILKDAGVDAYGVEEIESLADRVEADLLAGVST